MPSHLDSSLLEGGVLDVQVSMDSCPLLGRAWHIVATMSHYTPIHQPSLTSDSSSNTSALLIQAEAYIAHFAMHALVTDLYTVTQLGNQPTLLSSADTS